MTTHEVGSGKGKTPKLKELSDCENTNESMSLGQDATKNTSLMKLDVKSWRERSGVLI